MRDLGFRFHDSRYGVYGVNSLGLRAWSLLVMVVLLLHCATHIYVFLQTGTSVGS